LQKFGILLIFDYTNLNRIFMTKATYKYTIIYVKNVTLAIEFYEKAFGVERIFISPEGDYGELNTGSTVLAFANMELGNTNIKAGFIASKLEDKTLGIELAFVSENIKETWNQALEAGATVLEEIETKPWGQDVGYLRDPDGVLIEVCTPVS
jgi:lactoylglutathione lyase